MTLTSDEARRKLAVAWINTRGEVRDQNRVRDYDAFSVGSLGLGSADRAEHATDFCAGARAVAEIVARVLDRVQNESYCGDDPCNCVEFPVIERIRAALREEENNVPKS